MKALIFNNVLIEEKNTTKIRDETCIRGQKFSTLDVLAAVDVLPEMQTKPLFLSSLVP